MNTSINVPRHLLLDDDGNEPDDWAQARESAIRDARQGYRGLEYTDLNARKRGLDNRIEEHMAALERFENAAKFYELALRIAQKRATRHGIESQIVEALSPATAEDGWTLDVAAQWEDEEPKQQGARWEPSPQCLDREGIEPDSPHVPRSLSYGPEATWGDVLNDLHESVHMEEQNPVKRDLDELEFRRSVLESVIDAMERGMDDGTASEDSVTDVELADATAKDATPTQIQHLRTARSILQDNSQISKREDFEMECDRKGEPGGSVRKRVQELGKNRLDVVHLPGHYSGFDGGFQRLVEDLWADSLDENTS